MKISANRLIVLATICLLATSVWGQWGGGGFGGDSGNSDGGNDNNNFGGLGGGGGGGQEDGMEGLSNHGGGGYGMNSDSDMGGDMGGGGYGGIPPDMSDDNGYASGAPSSSGGFDSMADMPGDPTGGAHEEQERNAGPEGDTYKKDGNRGEPGLDEPIATGFHKTGRSGFQPPKGFRRGPQRGGSMGGGDDDMGGGAPKFGKTGDGPRHTAFNPALGGDYDMEYGDMGGMGEDEDEEGGYDWKHREEQAKKQQQQPDGPQRLDKCLKQVARYCSFRVMQENFAMFIECVSNMRDRIKQSCYDWADQHRPCAADVKNLCMKMSPPETTECMLASKTKLSDECVESTWYQSMEEGYEEFKGKMREAKQEGAPGSDGTDESDYEHDPTGMGGGYGSSQRGGQQGGRGGYGGDNNQNPYGEKPPQGDEEFAEPMPDTDPNMPEGAGMAGHDEF